MEGEKKHMSVVRRRRWTRRRVCITPEAKGFFVANSEWLQYKREGMLKFVHQLSLDHVLCVELEEQKRRPIESQVAHTP